MRFLIPCGLMFSMILLAGCSSTATADKPHKMSGEACATCAAGEYCAECAAKSGEQCAECKDGEMCAECKAKMTAGGEVHCAACAAMKGDEPKSEPAQEAASAAPMHADDAGEPVATINAKGMGCPLCASSADRRLMKVDGVKWANIDLGNGIVTVGLDPSKPAPAAEDLQAAIRDAGFTAEKVTMPNGEVTQ